MKTLVIGAGAREHALVKAIKSDSSVNTKDPTKADVFCFPGSDALSEEACPLPFTDPKPSATDLKNLGVQMVVMGPEAPLVEGWADGFRKKSLLVFGPSKAGAFLEGSKIYAKKFMTEAGIPTAPYAIVHNQEDVFLQAQKFHPPYVLKVDGLAAGKGVYICSDNKELEKAAFQVFKQKRFGHTSALIEEYQKGWELSYLVLTNGISFEALPVVQDHKRLKEQDKGPNTGGMGAIGPLKLPKNLKIAIEKDIVTPTIEHLHQQSIDYRGIIYIGLIITEAGPKVLEYNVRFGDPEAQVILPLLKGNWKEVFQKVAQGSLPQLEWKDEFVSVVVAAAAGYPENPQKGDVIQGDVLQASRKQYFLHAGTKKDKEKWLTHGGRVLNAVGIGKTPQQALDLSYELLQRVRFNGMQYRTDIGKSFL